jgi:hypothetical protein
MLLGQDDVSGYDGGGYLLGDVAVEGFSAAENAGNYMPDQFVWHEIKCHRIDHSGIFGEDGGDKHQFFQAFCLAGDFVDLGENLLITLGVEIDHRVSLADILFNQVFAQAGLTDTGGTENKGMPLPVGVRYDDGNKLCPMIHVDAGSQLGHEF